MRLFPVLTDLDNGMKKREEGKGRNQRLLSYQYFLMKEKKRTFVVVHGGEGSLRLSRFSARGRRGGGNCACLSMSNKEEREKKSAERMLNSSLFA